jgi:hypothetical protein
MATVVETRERAPAPSVEPSQKPPVGKPTESPKPVAADQNQPQTSYVLQASEISPFEMLFDMGLDATYVDLLGSSLQTLGFTIEDSIVVEEISSDTHHFTLVSRPGRERRFLIRVPDIILANANRLNRAALKEVIELFADNFGEGVYVIIFHEQPPNAVFDIVMKESARQRGLIIDWVPFSKIRDLQSLGQGIRMKLVQDILQLEPVGAAPFSTPVVPPKPNISAIPSREIDRLTDILASRPNFIDDKTHRRVLVESSGLEKIAENFNFDRGSKDVAFDLIQIVLHFGTVPETGLHAIQMFLQTVNEQDDLPSTDREYINDILSKYDFS